MLVIKFTNKITGDEEASFRAERYGDRNFEDVFSAIRDIVGPLNDTQKLQIKIGDIEQNFPIQVSYYDDEMWEEYDGYFPETVECIIKDITNKIIEQGNDNPTDVWMLFDRLWTTDFGIGETACLEAYWDDYPDADPLTYFKFVRDYLDEYIYVNSYEDFGKTFLFDIWGEGLPDGIEDYVNFESYGEDVLDGNTEYIDLISDCSIVLTCVGAWPTNTYNTSRFQTYYYDRLITRENLDDLLTDDGRLLRFGNYDDKAYSQMYLNTETDNAISVFLNYG